MAYSSYIPDLNEISGFEYEWDLDAEEYKEWLEENEEHDSPQAFRDFLDDNVTFTLEFMDHETQHSMGYATLDCSDIVDNYGEAVLNDMIETLQRKDMGYIEKHDIVASETVDINNPDEVNRYALKIFPSGPYTKNGRGFILTNGDIIYTNAEHSECTQIPGVKGTFHFIGMGNIRILPASIDIANPPTSAQKRTLAKIINTYASEKLYITLMSNQGEHDVTYTRPQWRVVLNEIDRYFHEGVKPTDRTFYEARQHLRHIIAEEIRKALFLAII